MPPSEILLHAADLETVLTAHGADVFSYERLGDRAVVRFTLNGSDLRLMVQMPTMDDFRLTPTAYERSVKVQREEYQRAVRRRWQALRTLVAAKLDAIEAEVTTFEYEFRQFEAPVGEIGAGTDA